jgi:hypothetical protein
MALPRKLVNALRAGKYTPSNASKRAREAASRLQESRRSSGVETGLPRDRFGGSGSGQPRDTFRSVKDRTISRKHNMYRGISSYSPVESVNAVEGSDEYRAMVQALGLSEAQVTHLASMASKAHAAYAKTGDAGELEIYLKYDFLFYHLCIPTRNGVRKCAKG